MKVNFEKTNIVIFKKEFINKEIKDAFGKNIKKNKKEFNSHCKKKMLYY